ncbi:hypothetical protein BSK65_10735 [Paenibacillus odorifer]|uniref:Uncharacterized protein n=1 Tax=Paenibacillus odorifer TaxID=189426 RepID=A0A1R0ZJM0_9BACL|nr:hypothetical protein [Paenibacillus odorifer]OME71508.1 hypothetical protein BSK65_10735 [Paenibacillus odorifer]
MTYKDVYDLYIQLLHIYEKNEKYQGAYQKKIDYYKRQFFLTEDIVQKIFVLNQLIKIYEEKRGRIVQCCSEEYFS